MSRMSRIILAVLLVLVVLVAAAVVLTERSKSNAEQDALRERVEELELLVRERNVSLAVEEAAAAEQETQAAALQTELDSLREHTAALQDALDEANALAAQLAEDAAPERLRRSIEENHVITEHRFETERIPDFGYLLYEPRGLDAAEPHPLVVYLHGTSGCGNHLPMIYSENSLPELLRDGVLTPNAYVLMPQCPWGGAWQDLTVPLMELIEHVVEETGADRTRISITGFSLGGIGTLYMCVNYPTYFSAAAPFAGAYNASNDCAVLTSTPVRMYHGTDDPNVGMSVTAINSVIRAAGGQSELVLFAGDGHSVQSHYADDHGAIVEWLIAQQRTDG